MTSSHSFWVELCAFFICILSKALLRFDLLIIWSAELHHKHITMHSFFAGFATSDFFTLAFFAVTNWLEIAVKSYAYWIVPFWIAKGNKKKNNVNQHSTGKGKRRFWNHSWESSIYTVTDWLEIAARSHSWSPTILNIERIWDTVGLQLF